MIVAHLIGGNEIKGVDNGVVIINEERLKESYEELVAVCGNIPLDELDTNVTVQRREKDVQRDYINLVREFNDELDANFVINNHLTKEISSSSYEVDFERNTLILRIFTY